jgi:hypothetical protein
LRYDEEKPGEILQFRESVSGEQSGLSCLIKDDRWKPIEIIRKCDSVSKQENYSDNLS